MRLRKESLANLHAAGKPGAGKKEIETNGTGTSTSTSTKTEGDGKKQAAEVNGT